MIKGAYISGQSDIPQVSDSSINYCSTGAAVILHDFDHCAVQPGGRGGHTVGHPIAQINQFSVQPIIIRLSLRPAGSCPQKQANRKCDATYLYIRATNYNFSNMM